MRKIATFVLIVAFSAAASSQNYYDKAFADKKTNASAERVHPHSGKKAGLTAKTNSMSFQKSSFGTAAPVSSYTPGESYFESFEDASLPEGWAAVNADGGAEVWEVFTHMSRTGSQCMIHYNESAGSGLITYDWLVSPYYTVNPGDYLTFYINSYSADGSIDSLLIMAAEQESVPTDSADIRTAFVDTLFAVNLHEVIYESSSDWVKFSVPLGKYAGKQIHTAFVRYSNGGGGLILDDVTFDVVYAKEVEVANVIANPRFKNNMANPVKASFHNNGIEPASFSASFEVVETGYKHQAHFENIAPDSLFIGKVGDWIPENTGTYTIKVYSELTGDEDTSNDTLSVTVEVIPAAGGLVWSSHPETPNKLWYPAAASYLKMGTGTQPDTNFLFIVGGTDADWNPVKTIYKYNSVTGQWSESSVTLPDPAYMMNAAQIGGMIYIPGGYTYPKGETLDSLYIYDIENDVLTTGAPMPFPSYGYSIGTYGDSLIYVISGVNQGSYLDEVQIYNVNTNTWALGTPFGGPARDFTAGSICGNKIVVAGGYYFDDIASEDVVVSTVNIGVIDPSNPYDITWTEGPDYPSGKVEYLSAGSWYGKDKKYVYFTCGYNDSMSVDYPDTWLYDVTNDNWLPGPDKITPTDGAGALVPVVSSDSVYLAALGGWNSETGFNTNVNEWLYIGPDDSYKEVDAAPVSVDFDTVVVKTTFAPTATFKNNGTTPGTFVAFINIMPGNYSFATIIVGLAPQDVRQHAFPIYAFDSLGTYTVKIYTEISGDENRHNDTLVTQVVVRSQGKDAAPFSVDFDTLAVNAEFTPKATFINKDYLTQTFVTYMEINPGGYFSADTLENLAYNAKQQVSFAKWTPADTGTYNVKIYTYLSGDENLSNDTLTSQVVVVNQGIDVAPFSVDFDTVYVNAAFAPKATFINKQALTQTFIVTMKIIPDYYMSMDTVHALAYGETEQITFPEWLPDTIGTYTAKIFTALLFDNNKSNDTLTKTIIVKKNIGIDGEMDVIPDVYSLSQNYPNPFNPTTVIRYGLPEAGNVELKVYDMLGREVQTLVSEYMNAGMHEVIFNAAGLNFASGVYIYRIKSGSFVQTKKLMLIK